MVIVDFRELRTIVTSSEAALHQLKKLMSGLFKQPLRRGDRPRGFRTDGFYECARRSRSGASLASRSSSAPPSLPRGSSRVPPRDQGFRRGGLACLAGGAQRGVPGTGSRLPTGGAGRGRRPGVWRASGRALTTTSRPSTNRRPVTMDKCAASNRTRVGGAPSIARTTRLTHPLGIASHKGAGLPYGYWLPSRSPAS